VNGGLGGGMGCVGFLIDDWRVMIVDF